MGLALLICLATIAGVLAIAFGARLLLRPAADGNLNDLAGSILFRIAALHGLVLALVFAAEVAEYQIIELDVATEANAVSDVFYDLDRYGAQEDTAAARQELLGYVTLAASKGWDTLGGNGTLLASAWDAWGKVYFIALDLEPASGRQETLRESILSNIDLIAEKRDLREHHAKTGLGPLFWSAAVLGVALIAVGYFIYPPGRNTVILMSLYGGYTGFILFTIIAMSNPFSAPEMIDPLPFQSLVTEFEAVLN